MAYPSRTTIVPPYLPVSLYVQFWFILPKNSVRGNRPVAVRVPRLERAKQKQGR